MRTIVYFDAFNLYSGSLRGTPYKWLDVVSLCRALLPGHTILRVKYFTARVSPRPTGPGQPQRQQAYLRALATPGATGSRTASLFKTEEKGLDVNLATHLVSDAVVGFLNPHRNPAWALHRVATFYKTTRVGVLAGCQLPTSLTDANGKIHKPTTS